MDAAQITAVGTASVAGLGSIGAGCRFVWKKVEARFAAIEAELVHCRNRERADQERRAIQLSVIEILWQEVERVTPDSFVLRRAGKLLDGLRAKVKGEAE